MTARDQMVAGELYDAFDPEWHQLYLDVLDKEPLIPARLVPFFLAVQPSEALLPIIGGWIAESP